ncbi:MAG: hypothetical protein H6701_02440 [Myxococcales bacterium]|nr:hypothetical protein [Myxococcales bacterium]
MAPAPARRRPARRLTPRQRILALARSTPARPARSSCSPRPPSAARTLWPAPDAPGFQGPPPPVPELAEQPTIGWLGRFTLDGALIAATHVFDPRRDDPANRRPGRLRCWTDTDATAAPEPTTLQLFRQSLAIGPHGEIALRARVARPLTTPDAWQPAPPTADATPVGMELIRVFDADLSTVLYSTVVEATTGDPMPGRTVIVEDITFDIDGRLLVVGRQIALQASGRLPTLAVPAWGRAEPYTIPEAIPAARAFLLRLALDPTCGE